MSRSKKFATFTAATFAVSMFVGASAFADSRHSDETFRGRDQGSVRQNRDSNEGNRTYHNNERVTVQGRVQSFARERGGYRVRLDRDGYSYWIPDNRMRSGFSLRVGININLGGVFRDNAIYVDTMDAPSGYDNGYRNDYYQNGFIHGVIVRVDYRYRGLTLREERTGRLINVDMRTLSRRSRLDINDLRPGDRVTFNGDWSRNGKFEVYEIDSVRTGRR
ncbi:MAG: hypothetical protein ACXVJT_13500 [Thermoanaerobaculia bacterium]